MRTAFFSCVVVFVLLSQSTNGVEIFSDKPIWSSGTKHSGGDGIARFVDFDRDGDLDFVTSAPDPMRWVLYRNEMGKMAQTPFWQSNETTDCDHIDVLDFNHDGWMDLAATHESHCTLYFNHSGKFNAEPDWETGMIANANQIDFGDFDQDGDFDMIMAAGEPVNGVAVFENAAGTPAQQVTQKLGHQEYAETAIFADIDEDGDLDIAAAYRGGKTVVFRNNQGRWGDGTVVYEDKANAWTQRLYWRDLDRDGQSELFCAKGPWGRQLGTSLQLERQIGTAKMKVRWQSAGQTAFHAFEFHDIDYDGDMDVIASDYAKGGNLFLYLNDAGKLSAEPVWSVKTSGPAHEAVLGDIDGDGDFDLAVGCRDQAHIYENLSARDSRNTLRKGGYIPNTHLTPFQVLTKLGVKLEPTQEQRATFKRDFRRLDNDGNQRLTAEEFGRDKFVTQDIREASFAAAFGARRLLKENDYLNSRVVGAEAERVFGALDANSNGSVSRGEFMANCGLANEGLASEIFAALDTDRDKSMQIAEHVTVFGEWAGAHKAPPTQHENVKYGPYDRNVFDIWLPDSKEPSALIVYIHGGGFVGGSKDGAWWSANVQKALDHGVAFASIQYRFRFEDQDETMSDPQRAGIQHILRDSARAIQYIRAHAKEYNLDKPRIACFGGSAGAGTSIWLAFHEDLADPDSPDPVLRESTRIAAAGMLAGQFTYDISRWDEAFKSRGGDIMATHGNGKKRPEFWKFFALSEEQYNGAQGEKWRADVDMQGLITAGDPPIFALTQGPDQAPLDRGIYNHHPYHALLIEQSCLAEGVEVLCLVPQVRKEDATRLKERPDIMMEFFFDKLGVSR